MCKNQNQPSLEEVVRGFISVMESIQKLSSNSERCQPDYSQVYNLPPRQMLNQIVHEYYLDGHITEEELQAIASILNPPKPHKTTDIKELWELMGFDRHWS